ncbi:serine/threonine-protein kinase [Sphaerisporangium sp. TRM90804]|uniref:serine/threonine-protein kinase n=1 Tax=Sphaerisporangium sp. TRM90804 TaxID=3031113 RepID=UPI0024480CD0|nr:serine/threonine-protein kinase [Sphaerisporangium sp. TRM90804]MDH2428061.1 protein kinase [Sphaerisporangium sp. TRM90804]
MQEGDVLTRRYRLVEQIASGGMSAIWRAFDQSLHRTVAIKVLDGRVGEDAGGRDLIRREARATARLIHPDAIEVYDYGETVTARGRLAAYVVMRLLDGRPLSERITEGGPLPWREAAVIGARVALVLAAAHQRGIVHRDVTAENVLLTPEGAKLLDFGIAAFVGERVEEWLADFGTPPYLAPERLHGATVHPAVDVYALGVLMFEMLTGAPPYPEITWEDVEAARRTGPPPVPSGVPGLPQEVAALCGRCLAQDPGDRPSAQHVAEVLTDSMAARARAGRETARWIRRARITFVGIAALATWTAALLWIQPEVPPPTAVAVTVAPSQPAGAAEPRTGAQSSGADEKPTGGATTAPEKDDASDTGTAPQVTTAPEAGPKPSRSSGSVAEADRPGTPSTPPAATPDREIVTAGGRPLTLTQAVGRFDAVLAEGEATGHIRDDVALDLRHVVHNLIRSGHRAGEVENVRRKIHDRAREGALTPEIQGELERRLDQIGAALRAGT